ncbi:MAG: lamin tail domain-containing protein [Candidatus Aenigmarchaeota archaeon]|nr:lamin tail domain-containing protein [Candidatus Aenigmarchaeota archaeon]
MDRLPLLAFLITFVAILSIGYLSSTGFVFLAANTDNLRLEITGQSIVVPPATECIEDWRCSDWSACSAGLQTRNCADVNDCRTVADKKPEAQECEEPEPPPQTDNSTQNVKNTTTQTQPEEQPESNNEEPSSPESPQQPQTQTPAPCTEDWQCGAWSACRAGVQTRTCTDQNACGTASGKPDESQACLDRVLFTEVYYDTADIRDEWIELYNPTNTDISLEGWTIQDNTQTPWTLFNYTIYASSYLTISRNSTSFSDITGCDPGVSGFTKGLNNDGDQLTLRDPGGNETDFVAWEGGASGAYQQWNISAARGKTIRRSPVDADTDSETDWLSDQEPGPVC